MNFSFEMIGMFFYSRSKEKMLKNIREITEELYKQYDFSRLLRILQRFGSQRDELRRKDASENFSDSEEEIDFSPESMHGRKRPTASVLPTTIIKRKRASGISI